MQEKPYRDELETRASAAFEEQRAALLEKLQARQTIRTQIEEMVGEGKAHFLTDEECALLHNFRRFKAGLSRNQRGSFMFRTWPDERRVVPGNEASLIEAPEI